MNARILLTTILTVAVPSALVAKTESATDENPAAKPRIEMAILLDTSGSMSGLINQARTELWRVVNEFATAERNGQTPDFYVGLYEYGNSKLKAEDGYIRQIVPLTNDLDKVSEELFKLTTSGGSEYCGQVIDRAVTELQWSKSAADLKCIFIAGNEPFTQGPVNYKDACKKAINGGITVSTIHCGDHDQGISTSWKDGSLLADGSYMSINQNKVVPNIEAPQDQELAKLSTQLNTTYVAYGRADVRESKLANQVAQDSNAYGAAPRVAASRALTKASHLYCNSSWDIVDACKLGKLKLEDLKEDQLPENLKKMTLEERKVFVDELTKKRTKIQTRIKELSKEREVFVSAELAKIAEKEGEETLDSAIIDAVKKQCVAKKFKLN